MCFPGPGLTPGAQEAGQIVGMDTVTRGRAVLGKRGIGVLALGSGVTLSQTPSVSVSSCLTSFRPGFVSGAPHGPGALRNGT